MDEDSSQLTVQPANFATLTTVFESASVRLPKHVHQATEVLAKSMGLTLSEVLNRLLETAYHVIAGIHRASHAFRKVPPPEWAPFVDALIRAQAEEEKEAEVLADSKKKRKERDRVRYLNAQLARVDVTKLEKDNRNPSGYKNVYRYNTGFRAQVCMSGKARYLPTRADAILAAQDRYEWYQRYGLAYGTEEKLLEETVRTRGGDKDFWLAINRDADDYMTGRGGFTDKSFQEHLDKIRVSRALAEAEDAKPKRGRPKKVVDVLARRAGVVTWLDEHRVVVEHEDGTALSYMPILRVEVWDGDKVHENMKLGEVEGRHTKVMIHEVPPPSRMRGRTTPIPAPTPTDPSYRDNLPTAAELKAKEAPASTQDADAAKEALKALIRKQKAEIAKTPTERISERIEAESVEYTPEDIDSMVDEAISVTEDPAVSDDDDFIPFARDEEPVRLAPVIPIERPKPPPKPAPQPSSKDGFFE